MDHHRAEGDRRGIGHQTDDGGLERLHAGRDQHGSGDGHWRSEARQGLEQRTQGEGDQDGQDAHVAGDGVDQVTEDLVPAHLDREVVEEDRADQDPHDLEHAEEDPLGGGAGCGRQRHPPNGDGEDDREDDGAKRSLQAAILKTPSITKRRARGSAATRAERARLPPTGKSG